MTRYFLDTSAHLERWGGSPKSRTRIKRLLGAGPHATSSHARREWKGVVDRSCIEVLRVLHEGSPPTFADLFARISKGYGRTTTRRVLTLSMLAGPDTELSTSVLQTRAEQWLRFLSAVHFEQQIDEIRDGSECGLARAIPEADRNGLVQLKTMCKKDDTICRQDDDLGGKLSSLEAAGKALLASSDAGHRKVGRVATEAVKTRRERKGKNCWALLGDVSIALECRPDETILTSDRSFDHIAPALALKLKRIPATLGP